MEWINNIPVDLTNFVWVVLFSLLVGLEQRVHHEEESERFLFGTDRTFTLIGILGYVFYVTDKTSLKLFILGGLLLSIFLAVYYFFKITEAKDFGMTSIVIALITYSFAPLIYLQNKILVLSIFVSILILTEIKDTLKKWAKTFDQEEFLTLSKFIILSGVVLPLLPKSDIASWLPVSLYEMWLAVMVVSGISYVSYILQRFVFPGKGLLLSALLGGFYSSTATTIVLSKKSKEDANPRRYVYALIAATGMMYFRLWILIYIFKPGIALNILPHLTLLAGLCFFIVILLKKKTGEIKTEWDWSGKNPLELKTAVIFGLIFVIFSVITQFALRYFGDTGIHWLAFFTGLTDIDPFILNILQGNYHLDTGLVISSVLLATASNNLMKLFYAFILGHQTNRKSLLFAYMPVIALNFFLALH